MRLFAAAALVMLACAPASAENEIVITQAKALAGNVTPGDAPGFPVSIGNRNGVFVLGSDLVPPAGQNGIEISTRVVTLDFAGYALRNGTKPGTGIKGLPGAELVTIRNGRVIGFTDGGVIATGGSWKVRDMYVEGFSLGKGIQLGGNARIDHVEVVETTPNQNRHGVAGVICTDGCLLSDSIIIAEIGVGMKSGSIINNVIQAALDLQSANPVAISGTTLVGYGNNTIQGAVLEAKPMQPNVCSPDCGTLN